MLFIFCVYFFVSCILSQFSICIFIWDAFFFLCRRLTPQESLLTSKSEKTYINIYAHCGPIHNQFRSAPAADWTKRNEKTCVVPRFARSPIHRLFYVLILIFTNVARTPHRFRFQCDCGWSNGICRSVSTTLRQELCHLHNCHANVLPRDVLTECEAQFSRWLKSGRFFSFVRSSLFAVVTLENL